MDTSNIKKKIYEAIGQDLDIAFSFIEEVLEKESTHYPTLLVRKGQWTGVKIDIDRGTLIKYSEECQKITNEIRNVLINIVEKATDSDFISTLGEAINKNHAQDMPIAKSLSMSNALYYVLRRTEEKYINPLNVPYGYIDVDKLTYGIKNNYFNLISGLSEEIGRLFALNIAIKISELFRKRVLYISFHLSSIDIAERLLSIKSKIKSWNISNGRLEDWEWQGVQESIEEMTHLPIFITDHIKSIEDIKNHILDILKDDYIELIIIDNIEYIDFDKNITIEDKIKKIKSINMEFNIPVLGLSTVNIKTGRFLGHKLSLSDVKIERTEHIYLDNIILVNHPESLGVLEDEMGFDLRNCIEISIVKNCNGESGDIRLHFDSMTGIISEYEINEDIYSKSFKMMRISDEDIPF